MGLLEELERLNAFLDDGTYRAQFEYGNDEMRLELLGTADLLFEVADKVEEVLTDLMVRQGFGLPEEDSPEDGGGAD
ncbi:MAG: hypothetical protein KKB20_16305 [Proteobacteria bacterium]|nr:hypothetical protein [Pseudomonadota bacterium]